MEKQSSWVSALCAFAIALGAMGMAGSAFGAVSLLFMDKFQASMKNLQPPSTTQQDDLIQKMSDDMQAATGSMQSVNIGLAIVNFFVSAALLMGGIQALRLRPTGRSLLVGACVAAAVLDFGMLAANLVTSVRASEVQSKYMQEIMKSGQSGPQSMPPGVSSVMAASAKVGLMIGLIVGLGWCVAKLAVYVTTIVMFRKPWVRSLFAEEPMFASDTGENTIDDLAGLDDLDH